jgi:2-polyprenyl-3-methyl-5-hydroxy-6-metoxy-1,4-benzoquinol methylase
MNKIAGRIISYAVKKAGRSGLIRSALEGPTPKRSYKVFGRFSDMRGNTFELLEGLRDELKPGWQAMLERCSVFKLPSKREMSEKIVQAKASVEKLLHVLRIFSFDISKKRILEIGCYDGARTYALALRGAVEVVGSDICSYYITQRVGSVVSEASVSEQEKYLMSLREGIRKAICSDDSKVKSARFVEDNISSSCLPDAYFDLVCSWEVLEHVENPQSVFQQIYRILRSGGIAFHEYNPFFCLTGGHSLCTLDFYWGHARLDSSDFFRYLQEIRHGEAQVAFQFYQHNLNRMTLADLEQYSREVGLETLALTKWSDDQHLEMINEEILRQSTNVYSTLTLLDLITPSVWLVQRKP